MLLDFRLVMPDFFTLSIFISATLPSICHYDSLIFAELMLRRFFRLPEPRYDILRRRRFSCRYADLRAHACFEARRDERGLCYALLCARRGQLFYYD